MSDTVSPATVQPATDADGKLLLSAEEARALLRECCAQFQSGLVEVLAGSLESTNDLFEQNKFVSDAEILDFRGKRGEWLNRFAQTYKELFERRLSGNRRRGRRPDADRSLASLRVLNAFDQEKQAALVSAADFLRRLTRREVDALDLRVGVLLGEKLAREIDNPFAPDHVLDAMGMTSRALLPNPRVWRPLMERMLADLTPAATKLYIRSNRLLADRHVLPEIKAELRARSDLRPADDSDLLPLFMRLIKEAAPPNLVVDVAVPGASAGDTPSPAEGEAARAAAIPAREPNPYAAELARAVPATPAPASATGLPQLDPMLALGSLSSVVAALDRWQAVDPALAAAASTPGSETESADAAPLPLNRIPWIRSAVAPQVVNPSDQITLDVIALLFDYIFRDPSIPDSLRELFARLEVPILKAALIDHAFFSDRKHPARKFLDHLAAAAVGTTGDDLYGVGFVQVATDLIDGVCREFKFDAAVFADTDARLQAFVEAEQRNAAEEFDRDVAVALTAEHTEAERSTVRAFVRDKLTGISVPFEVRGFAETVWCDYLTLVRRHDGEASPSWSSAVRVLDDLLWSITAKERNAQKTKLTKMVPALIRDLRAGGAAVQVREERLQPFLEAVYKLHMAAIKPKPKNTPVAAVANLASTAPQAPQEEPARLPPVDNVHDFVGEMVVGTWVAFNRDQGASNARLSWVSPMRTKYIFTTRSRGQALVVSPEELAWQLSEGTARLIVEPVPLFDRAVSSAIDGLARDKPGAEGA
jgi:hypothetical protein